MLSREKVVAVTLAADEIGHAGDLYLPVLQSLVYHLQSQEGVNFPDYIFSTWFYPRFGAFKEEGQRKEMIEFSYSMELDEDIGMLLSVDSLKERRMSLPVYLPTEKSRKKREYFASKLERADGLAFKDLIKVVEAALTDYRKLVWDSYRSYLDKLSNRYRN